MEIEQVVAAIASKWLVLGRIAEYTDGPARHVVAGEVVTSGHSARRVNEVIIVFVNCQF